MMTRDVYCNVLKGIEIISDECGISEFEKYYHRYTRYGPGHNCDVTCKKEKLCNLVTSNSKDIPAKSIECKEVEQIIDEIEENKNKKVWIARNGHNYVSQYISETVAVES